MQAGFLCGGLLVVAGCATPSSRAREHADLFKTFPLEVQQNVRQGHIELGYTRDMVMIAKGVPDRKYRRATAEGSTDIWSYVGTETESEMKRVQGRFHFTDTDGRPRTVNDDVVAEVQHRREYERLRVIFDLDGVVAIERLRR